MSTLDFNDDFKLAFNYITQTREHIFLTGKAGTGKTTFLRHLKSNCKKNIVVAAPTGVAAINAGGVTLHSLFQLPFAPFIPMQSSGWGGMANGGQDKNTLLAGLKYNRVRLALLRNLELLIIDEISMVRCDVLDAIDTILRSVRRKQHLPFGGVQLLMIGDLFQLPPVAQGPEWQILSQYYKSEFFFDSKVMDECAPTSIELKTIYRQNESTFINLLNAVRNNDATEQDLELLNSRYDPWVDLQDVITITSHNKQADAINQKNLEQIETRAFTYRATVDGDFSEYSYPADKELTLKQGAQVMFIKNDVGAQRKYFNGKIGKVVKLNADEIVVHCPGDDDDIVVPRESWDNTKYSLDTTNNKVLEEKMGSFLQYPLRLAWAVTIHKSQGLTFEKCAVEAAQSFASGQLYVALSRCTSLNGIFLINKIPRQALKTNEHVVQFYKGINSQESAQLLPNKQADYCKDLLMELYDFDLCLKDCIQLQKSCAEHRHFFSVNASALIDQLYQQCLYLKNIGQKFHDEIDRLITTHGIEQNSALQERMSKANTFYTPQLNSLIDTVCNHQIQIESKTASAEVDELMASLFQHLFIKKYYYQSLADAFSVESFFTCKNTIVIPAYRTSTYLNNKKTNVPADVINANLYVALTDVRNEICAESGAASYMVANQKTIIEMANYVPLSGRELENITGFAKAKVHKYGDAFLSVIQKYAIVDNLQSNMEHHPKYLKSVGAKERKVQSEKNKTIKEQQGINGTSLESYQAFKDGFTIEQIAENRKLSVGTIQGHLGNAISAGKLTLLEVMDAEKANIILKAIADNEGKTLTEIKNTLGDDYSFGDVRLGIAQAERNKEG
jgi:energy-coupling factor transporter ATP-binding protein EcfA2